MTRTERNRHWSLVAAQAVIVSAVVGLFASAPFAVIESLLGVATLGASGPILWPIVAVVAFGVGLVFHIVRQRRIAASFEERDDP